VSLVAGFTVAAAAGIAVLFTVLGLGLWIAAIVLLALAVFLFFWDFERDELFKDDWVEMAQAAASVVSGIAGLMLLVASVLV